jgi:hypothetical protein
MDNVTEALINICNRHNFCPFDYGFDYPINKPCPVCGDKGGSEVSDNTECLAYKKLGET